jgi:hypothetical protein
MRSCAADGRLLCMEVPKGELPERLRSPVHDEHERQQREAVEARLQTERGPPLVALLRR